MDSCLHSNSNFNLGKVDSCEGVGNLSVDSGGLNQGDTMGVEQGSVGESGLVGLEKSGIRPADLLLSWACVQVSAGQVQLKLFQWVSRSQN